MGRYVTYVMTRNSAYEIKPENCAHANVHQYAGFNDFRNSQYKCDDCGATKSVRADSRTMNSDNPWSYEVYGQ